MPPAAAPPPPSRRVFQWDPTINAGNIVAVALFTVGILGLWFKLEGKVELHDQRIDRLEAQRRADDEQTASMREAFAASREAQKAMIDAIQRVERKLERWEHAAGAPAQSQRPF